MRAPNHDGHRFRSSGDLIADRRLSYAEALAGDGDFEAAAELFGQTVERAPDWPVAWFKLAEVDEKRGCAGEAAVAYARALALDPRDELGAALHLARLGAARLPGQAPAAYVKSLFDQYAGRFDAHLLDGLGYRAPGQLLAAVRSLGERRFGHVIDLGCGTGLSGAAFRPVADVLTGADLSPGMIAEARGKGIYDRLDVADILDFVVAAPAASAALVIAGDVLCYVGDLAPLLHAVHAVLEPGGHFAATLQKGEGGFALGADLRFAHAPSYVGEAAVAAGFIVVVLEEAASRRDGGTDVAGLVVMLGKPFLNVAP